MKVSEDVLGRLRVANREFGELPLELQRSVARRVLSASRWAWERVGLGTWWDVFGWAGFVGVLGVWVSVSLWVLERRGATLVPSSWAPLGFGGLALVLGVSQGAGFWSWWRVERARRGVRVLVIVGALVSVLVDWFVLAFVFGVMPSFGVAHWPLLVPSLTVLLVGAVGCAVGWAWSSWVRYRNVRGFLDGSFVLDVGRLAASVLRAQRVVHKLGVMVPVRVAGVARNEDGTFGRDAFGRLGGQQK